jgi:hypothetical protein
MSILNKLRRWCPQPKMTLPANHTRLSKSKTVFASALAIEILLLLIVPIAYYALLAPKPQNGIMAKYPLTNEQIQASWPNLPTADEIIKDGIVLIIPSVVPGVVTDYSASNTTVQGTLGSVTNATVLNMPNYFNGGSVPKGYEIWLQHNDTWIKVPNKYLSTNSPPITPPEQTGFLGSGLSLEYIVLALLVILTTAAVGINLVARRRNPFPKTV